MTQNEHCCVLFNVMDDKVFEKKIATLRDKAISTCLACGAVTAQAEDVAQDVLLRLWQLRDTLDRYRSLEALVTVMARHELINHHRSRRDVPLMSINSEQIRSNLINPDESIISSQEIRWLNETMKKLPSTQYAVLHMRQVENLSYDEIARRIGIEKCTARSLLSKARVKLLEEIKKREHQR